MAAINLTEKAVNILVNDSLQQSYDQRANSADYNVSASADLPTSFNWSREASGSAEIFGAMTVDSFSLNSNRYVEAGAKSSNEVGTIEIIDSGGNTVLSTSYRDGEGYVDVYGILPSDTYDVFIDGSSTFDGNHSWDVNSADFITRSYRDGTRILPPINLTINGVSQS